MKLLQYTDSIIYGGYRRFHCRRSRLHTLICCSMFLILIMFVMNSLESMDTDKFREESGLSSLTRRKRSSFPEIFYSGVVKPGYEPFYNFVQFDQRLLPSLYLSAINREITFKRRLPDDFTLPFNWNMLTNSLQRLQQNPLYEHVIESGINCVELREKIPYGGDNSECRLFAEGDESNRYGLRIKISKDIPYYFKEKDMRKLYGDLHCLTEFKIPDRIVFLGALKGARSLIIPTRMFSDGKQDLKNNRINHDSLGLNVLVKEFIGNATKSKDIESVLINGVLGFDELSILTKLTKKHPLSKRFLWDESDDTDPSEPLYLDHSLFEWNITKEIDHLSPGDVFKEYFSQALNDNFEEVRHFGESYLQENRFESSHFDWRFFNGFTQPETRLHQATIHRLLRTWFRLSKELQVYSWISHGSLIGYYWNGYSLPFDNDIDIQVPIQSLYKLARMANNSVIFDMTNDNYVNEDFKIDSAAEIGFRSYYLDVNPLFGSRSKLKSSENVIDARFIDVTTGLFIDITGLASFSSYTNNDPVVQKNTINNFEDSGEVRFMQSLKYDEFYDGIVPKLDIFDVNRLEVRNKIKIKGQRLFKDLISHYETTLDSRPNLFDNLVNCRNYHFYDLREFLPLVPTYFENMLVYIPSNWLKLLMMEYDYNAISKDRIAGYAFLPMMNMWVSSKTCQTTGPDLDILREKCFENEYLRNEYHRVDPYVKTHKSLLNLILPFDNLTDVANIEDTFAIKHYNKNKFKEISLRFDNSLLRPEPWIAENLFKA